MKYFPRTLMLAACCISAGAVQAQGTHSGMAMSDMKAKNAQMLIDTLSEEKTEINALMAQQTQFKKMGDPESRRLASLWGRMIREHKAAGPTLMKLIRVNGGDPMDAKILKPPVLGDEMTMLHATHMDHEKAVMASQMRYAMTNSSAIKLAMHKRGNLARKHIRQMMPYMKGDMKGGGHMMNSGATDMSGGMAHPGSNSMQGTH